MNGSGFSSNSQAARRGSGRAVGPRLRWVFYGLLAGLAVLGANSLYLAGVTLLSWMQGHSLENQFYQYMFLGHLGLGLLLLAPTLGFIVVHMRQARRRPNRRAARVGYLLAAAVAVLFVSGLALLRVEGFAIKNPHLRAFAYWAHVLTPLLGLWLYLLHRLAGPRIRWRVGGLWGSVLGVLLAAFAVLHIREQREVPASTEADFALNGQDLFFPSSSRTARGELIPAPQLMMDQYCKECHADAWEGWFHSAHHFSSFNNPAYRFSVEETRRVLQKRDGHMQASRWCAGCHDPVPLFSGLFDDPSVDLAAHPAGHAGITCTACHAITQVNSTRGNGDYTIEAPRHYPFTFSSNAVLRFLNRQLIKAKPEFHKRTFLKPVHRTAEFCSVCHKVSLPYELTHYKEWLRGQNHYDSFLLSGVSGHGARSFYYPEKAATKCADCHMPLQPSRDFGAQFFDAQVDTLTIHNHLFPAANTALPYWRGDHEIVQAHQAFLQRALRVDIFGLRQGGTITGKLLAPLRPMLPALVPGETYLLEVVIRTVGVGHHFTQGTSDSNEVWVDTTVRSGGRVIGRSGGLGEHNTVDPWAHFINTYMLDRFGRRIDRRNAQDIFTPLYNHQIGPGSAQVVHYALTIPPDTRAPIEIEVKVQYRKFDTHYVQYIFGPDHTNTLPITTLASDRVILPVAGTSGATNPPPQPPSLIPEWQRWNDYGIGLLLEGDTGSEKGELRQAAEAFARVEALGRPDGPVNLARVYFKEGRLAEAVQALQRAAEMKPAAPRWTLAWFNGLVNKQNGHLDQAINDFRSILQDRYPELEERRFDFSLDYVMRNELGATLFERAKWERGPERKSTREAILRQAAEEFQRVLEIDSENLTAHYNLALIYDRLGRPELAEKHRRLHERYRPDDNARDKAVAIARLNDPAADHAAQAIVIYPLQRPGAPGLDTTTSLENPPAGTTAQATNP